MSKYTTKVQNICESLCNLTESVGANGVDDVIENSMDKIFDFEYPIFDVTYKRVLQKKILKHYYTREIGGESYGLWKLWLNTRLNEIMPYYNKLYESETYKFNPLYDVDVTRTHEGSGSSGGTSKLNDVKWNKYSATPQGSIEGLENDEYLTEATKDTSEQNTESTVNTTDNYIERVVGKQSGVGYAKMINDYRNILLNIDMQIIKELSDLFMNVW